MKRINCFIPYGKIEATRQTVAQLAESSLVSQIYLITVSYTHLDVYKRQLYSLIKEVYDP